MKAGEEGAGLALQLLYFAALRELLGLTEERIVVPPNTQSVADLAAVLVQRHPPLAAHLGSVRFAVNEVFVPNSAPLADGDVVALIPPVSGG